MLGLALIGGCTRTNPAYRITAEQPDAGEENPPAPGSSDAASGPDLSPPPDEAAEDLATPEDTAPDLALLDLAQPADLAPPDRAPDLAADSGVSNVGLAAYWRLDERSGTAVADATGNGNTGATKGGPLWVTGGFPAIGFANTGALDLDGEDDYVEISNKTIPGSAAPKTLSAWFKARNAAAIPIRNLVALINETSDVGVQMGLDHGKVSAWFFGDTAPMVAAHDAVDGNWHHAAYTFDGKTHRIYYDGKFEAERDVPPKSGTIARTRLGTWGAPEEMFDGLIDDVRIYARALSDGEIATLGSGQ